MRKLTIAAVLAAQLVAAAQPAMAADFDHIRAQQAGAFAGLRLRMPLDGSDARRQPVRLGLALAPTLHSQSRDGAVRTRFGEGLELGIKGDSPVRLSFAGRPVSRLAQGLAGPDGDRAGVSTLGWIAIGVGALVTIVVVAGAICLSDSDCIPSE